MKKHEGFTIIETSLFLAISAALVLLALGLAATVARQRFQDTMISLRTVIQAEYEEVRNGINPRLGGEITSCTTDEISKTAGKSNCLVLGKVIQFEAGSSEVKISYVVMNGDPGEGDNDIEILTDPDSELYAVGGVDPSYTIRAGGGNAAIGPQTYQVKWGGEVVGVWDVTTGEAAARGTLAILRSPSSGAIVAIANVSLDTFGKLTFNDPNNPIITDHSLAVLIRNDMMGLNGAAICIGPGSVSTNVKTAIPASPIVINNNNPPTLNWSDGSTNLINALGGLCAT